MALLTPSFLICCSGHSHITQLFWSPEPFIQLWLSPASPDHWYSKLQMELFFYSVVRVAKLVAPNRRIDLCGDVTRYANMCASSAIATKTFPCAARPWIHFSPCFLALFLGLFNLFADKEGPGKEQLLLFCDTAHSLIEVACNDETSSTCPCYHHNLTYHRM